MQQLITAFSLLLLINVAWAETLQGLVLNIIDGDTVILQETGTLKQYRIRLSDIDTPEMKQPYGMTAKKHLALLIQDNEVRANVKTIDKYGRTVARLFVKTSDHEWLDVNAAMIENGHAWWYEQYSTDKKLKHLQLQAWQARRGLWGQDNNEPPWEYRQHKKRGR